MISQRFGIALVAIAVCLGSASVGCLPQSEPPPPRSALFIGIDVSGSFMKGKYFDDSMEFLANYVYAHLKGLGGLEVPKNLFVGAIGGDTAKDAKTFFPIETFEGKSVAQIRSSISELFPKGKVNRLTDFNAFFTQVATTVSNRNLILKPLSIVMFSDGIPDAGKGHFRGIKLDGLERLSRNVTIRLLYTDANTGSGWQNKVKRARARIWTQDASVMTLWREPSVYDPSKSIDQQTKFFEWIKDNVDFGIKAKRVD